MVGRLVSDVFLDTVKKREFFLGGGERHVRRDRCRKSREKGRRNGLSLWCFGVVDFGALQAQSAMLRIDRTLEGFGVR